MPLTTPQTLRADEVYSLVAYILSIDGVVKADAVLDAKSLPAVKMPNRDGFLNWWENPRR
jgi:S-disulfanyl-L-cysteine oxidoreductase SoxD